MAQSELTPQLLLLEEALTILFCQVDDAYYRLNPKGRHYETLKELSDSEVITLEPYSSSFEVLSPSVLSCARLPASSGTCSLEPSVFTPPPSIVAYASSGATSSPCAAPSCPNWWANLRL
jgi:hypothetical protein